MHNHTMKELTYTQAIQRLEQITRSIEEGTLDIDQLASQLKEAQTLLGQCKKTLQKVESDVNKILQNDEQE